MSNKKGKRIPVTFMSHTLGRPQIREGYHDMFNIRPPQFFKGGEGFQGVVDCLFAMLAGVVDQACQVLA